MFMYGVQFLPTRQPVLWSYTGHLNFCALWKLHLSAWEFHYDIIDSKVEVTIIFLNFHSGLVFVLKEVEDVWEKGKSVKWTCAKRSCRKGQKCQKCFLGKTFSWQKLCVIVMKSNNITAEVMLALHMNKSCKVESCYPIQKCFGRFRDTWWNYAQICFHLWQLTETLRQQPKKGVKCHRSPHRISIISICILLLMKKAVTSY